MAEKDWDFDYTINTKYQITDNTTWAGDWGYHPLTTSNNTVSWTYTNIVYMYQIFCPKPRCKGIFWGQIDSVVECPKCKSRVKITNSPPPDYEVEVTK